MVIERAQLPIKPGGGDDLAAAVPEVVALLGAAAGCHGARFGRGVEEPDTWVLLVEWDAVDDHVAYTKTPDFETLRGLLGPHLAGAPEVLHFEVVG
ncbi:antibiotic biosynthesis monooxygenase family protein [Patulibacter minatonensis]|uniref:antibiotic biosynthesis monooxygenase family protein n=1 Tax=Patulibacter minatonensis TaxID=298163 RepID=UPI000479EB8B|nr:antibiotic biosynthesis monooxygenase family protein [Patulibacter minatonensis]